MTTIVITTTNQGIKPPTAREYSRHGGHGAVGSALHVALVVQRYLPTQEGDVGAVTDRDEGTIAVDGLHFPGRRVHQLHPCERVSFNVQGELIILSTIGIQNVRSRRCQPTTEQSRLFISEPLAHTIVYL